jgi:hypothetical protein
MRWFSVKTLMVSIIEEAPEDVPLFDESLMLVKANSPEEAEEKAKKLCHKLYEVDYKNGDDQIVSWKFVKIIEVSDLGKKTLRDGVQIYSRLF